MKRIKKLASLLLAMVMVFAMSATAFAADNHEYTIKINGNEADKGTHVYQAYQIFKGDLANAPVSNDELDGGIGAGGKYVLSNIEWGDGITDGTKVIEALKADSSFNYPEKGSENLFASCESAKDVAERLSVFVGSDANRSELIDKFATIVSEFLSQDYYLSGNDEASNPNVIRVNGAGYYLVKDMNASLGEQEDAAYTRFLLEVVGNSTVNVKSEVPSGDKEVFDPNGPDEETGKDTTDANYGAAIGTHVSYKITSKVPNHVGYETYFFVMNDTLSKGLTFDGAETVAVTVGGKVKVLNTDYYVYTGKDAKVGDTQYTFRLAFADIMSENPGDDIVVTYSATINNDAVIGTTGNANTWDLTYSNNPYDTSHGKPNDNNNPKPGLPVDEEDNPLGKTPEEKTLTYLTELDITKTDAAGALLAGATFTLTGTSKQVVLKDVEYYAEWTDKSEGTPYYKLLETDTDNGLYTSTPPTGTEYKEIGVGDDDTKTGYLKRVVDGKDEYYLPEDTKEYKGQTIYALVKGTADKYADVNQKYELVKAQELTYVDEPIRIELTSDDVEGSVMKFAGLGAGKYTLTETITPAGYNTIDPIEFEIVFKAPDGGVVTGEEICIWEITNPDFKVTEGGNGVSVGGIFSADIVNQSGSLLPSTGGIGTTIFYVVGAILVIGAGILLVTKKRMSAR